MQIQYKPLLGLRGPSSGNTRHTRAFFETIDIKLNKVFKKNYFNSIEIQQGLTYYCLYS